MISEAHITGMPIPRRGTTATMSEKITNYVARMEAKWDEREEIRARIRSLESRLQPRA